MSGEGFLIHRKRETMTKSKEDARTEDGLQMICVNLTKEQVRGLAKFAEKKQRGRVIRSAVDSYLRALKWA
jgi:hypothetical protein